MPEDYRKVVFNAYKKKKAEMNLSPNLLDPTPGNLRAECLIIHHEKYTPKDYEVLRSFFNDGDKERGYIKSIENSPAEKFKQMSKILKGAEVKNPGIKYFELLEWLMSLNLGTSTQYYRRFYEESQLEAHIITNEKEEVNKIDSSITVSVQNDSDDGKNEPKTPVVLLLDNGKAEAAPITRVDGYGTTLHTNLASPKNEKLPNQIAVEEVVDTIVEQAPNKEEKARNEAFEPIPQILLNQPIETTESKTKSKLRSAVLLATVIAIAGVGSYAFFNHINQQCMYWTGNRYQAVGCSVKMDQASIIALDEEKLTNLKRITRLDTIGGKDLGRVWYVKIKQDSAEFYTSAGEYPLNPKKRLLPMTQYILDKYILR